MLFKLLGIVFLVTATSLTGLNFSLYLKNRRAKLELIKRMIDDMSNLIRYRALTVKEIISELSLSPSYSNLIFLNYASQNIQNSIPFSEIWEKSVEKDFSLKNCEKSELISLGYAIGSTDIEGQISTLNSFKEKFLHLISQADDDYKQKGKLYRSLGVLSGIFISVIIV